jgi:hypothetical protein
METLKTCEPARRDGFHGHKEKFSPEADAKAQKNEGIQD